MCDVCKWIPILGKGIKNQLRFCNHITKGFAKETFLHHLPATHNPFAKKKTGKNFPPFSHSHFKFIWLKKKSKGNLRSLFNVQKKAISLEIVSFLSFQLKMVSNISATANSTWQTCVSLHPRSL